MMHARRFLCLLAASVLPFSAPAAETKPATEGPPQLVDSRYISIDFSGGTLGELLTAVNKIGGAGLNVIGEPTDLNTAIPAFSIRFVTPSALAVAINQFIYPRGLGLNAATTGRAPEIFVLTKGTVNRREDTKFESFQLSPFIGQQSVDDIVTAIRDAWQLTPGNRPDSLQLKFHPPTSILLASGTEDAIITARKVIGTLRPNPPKPEPKPKADPAPAPEKK